MPSGERGEGLERGLVVLVLPELVADDEVGRLHAVAPRDGRGILVEPVGAGRRVERQREQARAGVGVEAADVVGDVQRVDDQRPGGIQHACERRVAVGALRGREEVRQVLVLEVEQVADPGRAEVVRQRRDRRQQGVQPEAAHRGGQRGRPEIDRVDAGAGLGERALHVRPLGSVRRMRRPADEPLDPFAGGLQRDARAAHRQQHVLFDLRVGEVAGRC